MIAFLLSLIALLLGLGAPTDESATPFPTGESAEPAPPPVDTSSAQTQGTEPELRPVIFRPAISNGI